METMNPYFSFWFIELGGVSIAWKEGLCHAGASSAILVPPGLRRTHRFSRDNRIVSLSFSANWDDGRPILAGREPWVNQTAAARKLRKSALAVVREMEKLEGPIPQINLETGRWLVLQSALLLAMAAILDWASESGGAWNLPETGDARLDRILADLRAAPSAAPLPFARWSKTTGLGRVQLERMARARLGESLRDRRDAELLENIRQAALAGKESFKEIAARLHFCDAAHFTRWVRHRTGRSPKGLRDAWRAPAA